MINYEANAPLRRSPRKTMPPRSLPKTRWQAATPMKHHPQAFTDCAKAGAADWPDRARGGPETMVLRESAAREVAREGPQILPRFRLENVDPHGLTLSAIERWRQTCRRRP